MPEGVIFAGRFYRDLEAAIADAINMTMSDIFLMSQIEVPKATDPKVIGSSLERYGMTLVMSGRYGGGRAGPRGGTSSLARGNQVDLSLRATPGDLHAEIIYESPYALAQHEGAMTYVRDGKEIEWEVQRYSTSGTKKHYLSDPLKAAAPTYLALTENMINGVCAAYTEASAAACEEFIRTGVMPK